MNTVIQYNDPQEIEKYSSQLFDQERFYLKKKNSKEFSYLYENKWIGLPHYCHRLSGDWVRSEEFMQHFTSGLEKAMTLEEATEIALENLKLWGKQVVAEFVGAISLLEAKSKLIGSNVNIIEDIRNSEGSYVGYLKLLADEMGVLTDEPFAISKPISENASGFFQWMFGVIDISLINRRELIKDALQSEIFDQIMLKLLISTKDVFEDASLLSGYIAVKLELHKFYK